MQVCSKEGRRLEAEDNGCPQTDRWAIEEKEEEEEDAEEEEEAEFTLHV